MRARQRSLVATHKFTQLRNIMTSIARQHHGSRLAWPIAFAGAFSLAACASTPPPPTEALAAAHQAIANAERADAGHFAPGELTEARSKLAAADADVANRYMAAAQRFAEESRVSAELASATTEAAKAKAVNADLQRGNHALSDETQRNSGTNP